MHIDCGEITHVYIAGIDGFLRGLVICEGYQVSETTK